MPAAKKPSAKPKKAAIKTVPTKGPQVGDKAPAFSMPSLEGNVSLAALKGKKILLYFYPKDDTSGCTAEACAFQDHLPKFKKSNVVIIGISKDSIASHETFSKKYKLAFNLASDEDTKVASAYGVRVQKSMYGRTYMGMERATFLINEKGFISHVWRNVKVPGHAADVLAAVKA